MSFFFLRTTRWR